MATTQEFRDLFDSTGTFPALTNAQLTKLSDYIDGELGTTGAGVDEVLDFFQRDYRERVTDKNYGMAQNQLVRDAF